MAMNDGDYIMRQGLLLKVVEEPRILFLQEDLIDIESWESRN